MNSNRAPPDPQSPKFIDQVATSMNGETLYSVSDTQTKQSEDNILRNKSL